MEINAIIREYSTMVMQIAYQNCFNKSDAEDITQEVFIRLLKNLDKLTTKEYLKAWIIRVTINLSKDYNKSFWAKNTVKIDENIKLDYPEHQDVFIELSKLKPKYRNVIYLYYYQGYKIAEIAKILKMNPNTVSSSLTRAKKQLGKILEDGGETYA